MNLFTFRYDDSGRLINKQNKRWIRDNESFNPYEEWKYAYHDNLLKYDTLSSAFVNDEYQEVKLHTYEYDTNDNPLSMKLKYLNYFDFDLTDPFSTLDIIYKPHEEFYRYDTDISSDNILLPRETIGTFVINRSETSIPLEFHNMLNELEFDENAECSSCGFTRTFYYSEMGTVSDNIPVESNDFSLYPNPTTGLMQIELKDGAILGQVSLYTSDGELVMTGDDQVLDLSAFDSGIYWVKVVLKNGIESTRKVVRL